MAAAGRVRASATRSDLEVSPSELLGSDIQAMSALLDDALGPYHLLDIAGGGGLGLVFEAHDERLGRRVAIKALRRSSAPKGAIRREAQALAALAHPNVLDVFDVVERNGREYLVMEFVEGTTLRQWQRGKDAASLLSAYRTVALGLAAVHTAGLVHCDIKPDNVLVAGDGRILVGDFGLAILSAPDGVAGRAPGGTPRYMAPEQCAGDPVSPATDQYSFCVSLWEALTGALPRTHAATIPSRLREVLLRGLSPRSQDRWPSMQALELALRTSGRKRSWRAIGVTVGIVAAGAMGLAALHFASDSTQAPSSVAPSRASIVPTLDLRPATELATVLARAHHARGRGELLHARGLLAAAAEQASDPATEATLKLRWAAMLDYSGERTEAAAMLDELETETADAPDRLRASIALELARTRPVAVPSGGAEDWLRTARARLLRAGVDPSFDLDARRVAASIHRQTGDDSAAAQELDAALDLIGPSTPPLTLADILREQAQVFSHMGRHDDAEAALDRASELLAHDDLERSDVNMLLLITRGNLQWYQGKKRFALDTLQEAVDLAEVIEGSSHVELGRVLNDLGSYAMELNQVKRARTALLRAERLLPSYYAIKANLAIHYGKAPCNGEPEFDACVTENKARSYRYQLRAYELAREQLPAGHPSLAQMAGNLAYDYTQQGRYVLALQHYEESLDGLTASYGKTHLKLTRPLLGALEVAVRTGNQTSARALAVRVRRTADANRKSLGPAAIAVIDYALLRTSAWTHGDTPADPDELKSALAFFEGHPPQDVGMIDTWFETADTSSPDQPS